MNESSGTIKMQILIFNETILNIMTNVIPHKTKIFSNREPPWINNKEKTVIQVKKIRFISFI